MVEAFEGNRAETTTMLPTITAFMAAHRLADVTIVADAGMVSEANKKAIETAGLSFILGARIPQVPYVVADWRKAHPDEPIGDGQIFIQPWPAGPADKRDDQMIFYQYRADRARRTLRGIDEQVAKAEKAVAGKVPVKRNRFIKLVGANKSVDRAMEAKARGLAGLKGYITNLPDPSAEFVIGAYHRLYSRSRNPSGCPNTTSRRARSTTTPALRSTRTSLSCSPRWPSAGSSRTAQAGRSASSCAPPAATEPSKSASASTYSPPKTRYPSTYAMHSPKSTERLRTKLAQLGVSDKRWIRPWHG